MFLLNSPILFDIRKKITMKINILKMLSNGTFVKIVAEIDLAQFLFKIYKDTMGLTAPDAYIIGKVSNCICPCGNIKMFIKNHHDFSKYFDDKKTHCEKCGKPLIVEINDYCIFQWFANHNKVKQSFRVNLDLRCDCGVKSYTDDFKIIMHGIWFFQGHGLPSCVECHQRNREIQKKRKFALLSGINRQIPYFDPHFIFEKIWNALTNYEDKED